MTSNMVNKQISLIKQLIVNLCMLICAPVADIRVSVYTCPDSHGTRQQSGINHYQLLHTRSCVGQKSKQSLHAVIAIIKRMDIPGLKMVVPFPLANFRKESSLNKTQISHKNVQKSFISLLGLGLKGLEITDLKACPIMHSS